MLAAAAGVTNGAAAAGTGFASMAQTRGSLSDSPRSANSSSPPASYNPHSPHQVTTIDGHTYVTDADGAVIDLDDITKAIIADDGSQISINDLLGFNPPYDIVAIHDSSLLTDVISGAPVGLDANYQQDIFKDIIETDDVPRKPVIYCLATHSQFRCSCIAISG